MRQPSLNRSRISRSVAAIALLALLLAGTFYVLPRAWTHSTKNAPVQNSLSAVAPPPAIHEDASTRALAPAAVTLALPLSRKAAPEKFHSATLNSALQKIPVSPAAS